MANIIGIRVIESEQKPPHGAVSGDKEKIEAQAHDMMTTLHNIRNSSDNNIVPIVSAPEDHHQEHALTTAITNDLLGIKNFRLEIAVGKAGKKDGVIGTLEINEKTIANLQKIFKQVEIETEKKQPKLGSSDTREEAQAEIIEPFKKEIKALAEQSIIAEATQQQSLPIGKAKATLGK